MNDNDLETGHSSGVPQRRRVRASEPAVIKESKFPPPQRVSVHSNEYVSNGGATAAKQSVLYRLQQGWLSINDLTHFCCVARRTVEVWFEQLGAVPVQQTGLPGSGPDMRSRLVRRADLEKILGDEGWRVVRSQQDDPDVREALIGNEDYPLLSKLLTWATEPPRRKLPLLDLALELHLSPSDAAFDLNREIDWADQAGLMRDEFRRADRLAVARLSASRDRPVELSDLVTLEQWSEGKPFKMPTTRVLARQRKLEHLHAVVNDSGEVLVWLVPSWAEILKEAENFKVITDYEPINYRLERLGEGRDLVETAIELGLLKSYKWGKSTFLETRELREDEKETLQQLLLERKQTEKVEKAKARSRINFDQAKTLEESLKKIFTEGTPIDLSADKFISLQKMVTVARMKAQGETLDACGVWLGVTRERARQILGKYERYYFICQAAEKRVIESFLNETKNFRDTLSRQRLKVAFDSGISYLLVNQIFIEVYVFGNTLGSLYTPTVSPKIISQMLDSDGLPELTLEQGPERQKNPVPWSAKESSADEQYPCNSDQERHLNLLVEATVATLDEAQRSRHTLKVVVEECDIAFLTSLGKPSKEVAKLFQLTSSDVEHMLRRHRAKLAKLENVLPYFAARLNKVTDQENLPLPIQRILQHNQAHLPFSLLNALFIETELFRVDVEELFQLIPEGNIDPFLPKR